MEFFRKNEQVEFHQGDVIRFKNSDNNFYRYAIISKLPDSYTAIILNEYGPFFPGESYETAGSIDKLIDGLNMSWDIVEKARTRTEDLTD